MVILSRLTAPLTVAMLVACRSAAPPPAIDPALSARVPTSTIALAGVDLDQLRASPLYPKLPPAALAFLAPFGQAHRLLIAYSDNEILSIARGTVPGATQLAPDLALSGAPDLIAAANQAHPPAAILAAAGPAVARSPIWFAIRGGVALPLAGNLTNINNLLRSTEFVTLSVQPGDPVGIELLAKCPTPAEALRFEQSFRAIVSLAAASTRQPATVSLLQSVRILRDDQVVRVSVYGAPDTLVNLLF